MMSSDIFYHDATRLAELIRTREISPVEVVRRTSTALKPSTPRSTRSSRL